MEFGDKGLGLRHYFVDQSFSDGRNKGDLQVTVNSGGWAMSKVVRASSCCIEISKVIIVIK